MRKERVRGRCATLAGSMAAVVCEAGCLDRREIVFREDVDGNGFSEEAREE